MIVAPLASFAEQFLSYNRPMAKKKRTTKKMKKNRAKNLKLLNAQKEVITLEEESSQSVAEVSTPKESTSPKTPPAEIVKYKSWQSIVAYFIFLQALVATLGSLYYSTFGDPVKNLMMGSAFPWDNGFTPCELCWFARILMYPIVILSLVGMLKEDRKFTQYILPLSMLGVLLDTYHYAIQKLPIHTIFRCSLSNPCNALQVQYFGFITIPFLALVAFIVITTLALVNTWLNKKIDALETSTKK
jgi:hypothetical protein